MAKYTCAMCGNSSGTSAPHGGFKIPPKYVQLLKNSHSVDESEIAGKVKVDLCADCNSIAKEMVREYGQSPLPECDAESIRYDRAEMLAAFSEANPQQVKQKNLAAKMIKDAHALISNQNEAHILDASLFEAQVLVQTYREWGMPPN